MTGRIPSAGYKAWMCTTADCTSVKPQLQQYFCCTFALSPLSSIMWVCVQPQNVACVLAQGRLFCKVSFCVSALCALQMCLAWCVGLLCFKYFFVNNFKLTLYFVTDFYCRQMNFAVRLFFKKVDCI